MKRNLIRLGIFAISMAFLESAVVVYIRELYYPDGFHFPLKPISSRIIITELIRELATVLMLISVARMVSRNGILRFANFIYAFAIWDIFYYLFLKLILNWPQSFLTWDILFLLPMVWVGPVIAPVILSLLMIAWTFILYGLSKNKTFRINPVEWVLMISGALMSIVTFTKDYFAFAKSKGAMQLAEKSHEYIPGEFDWFLFSISLALILLSMIFYVYRVSRTRRALQMQQLY